MAYRIAFNDTTNLFKKIKVTSQLNTVKTFTQPGFNFSVSVSVRFHFPAQFSFTVSVYFFTFFVFIVRVCNKQLIIRCSFYSSFTTRNTTTNNTTTCSQKPWNLSAMYSLDYNEQSSTTTPDDGFLQMLKYG